MMKKYKWKKILIRVIWILAGTGTFVLLGAAMHKKNRKPCTDIKIEITGVERHMFIDEKDVLDILNVAGPVMGNQLSAINLRSMETVVERNPWVKNAEMFLDNNRVLQVSIEERQPVARVFTLEGASFYVDSAAMRLPLSEKISARVPVFTGFPSGKKVLAKPDSALLGNIVSLGKYILADSFWMAQVAQIEITPQSGFELVPVLGDHIIAIGNAEDLAPKFRRLFTFYQKAWMQNGINTYEKIDVQYSNQVVAVRKGTAKAWVDSARSREIMSGLLAQAEAGLKDSSRSEVFMKSVVTKPAPETAAIARPVAPVTKAAVNRAAKIKSALTANNKTSAKTLSDGKKPKPVIKKAAGRKTTAKPGKPKAVMGKGK